MSQPLHGVTAEDFLSYITIKRQGRVPFCMDCGKELTENDPSPCCSSCDEAYGDYIADIRAEADIEARDVADEMILDNDMEV